MGHSLELYADYIYTMIGPDGYTDMSGFQFWLEVYYNQI